MPPENHLLQRVVVHLIPPIQELVLDKPLEGYYNEIVTHDEILTNREFWKTRKQTGATQ